MKDLQWYDVLRGMTCILSLISLYFLARRARRHWSKFTVYLRDIWFALVGFQILLIEGTIEQTILGVVGGPRTLLALLVAAVCLKGTRKGDAEFLKSWTEAQAAKANNAKPR